MAVVKPGAREHVGNMSAPVGQSFNEGILEESLKEWRMVQTTSKQIANTITRSGRKAALACSDMCNAYKCLPVCRKQKRLQVFNLPGREFCGLRLIFGDKWACMRFDRFNYSVIANIVLPGALFPLAWTIDDDSVTPARAKRKRRNLNLQTNGSWGL